MLKDGLWWSLTVNRVNQIKIQLFLNLFLETEGRTLHEIEDHFSGKKKLPKSLKQKDMVSEIPFPPNFNVTRWESNEKFEKHLQNKNIISPTLALHNLKPRNGLPLKASSVSKTSKKTVINEEDFDTPLWLIECIVKEDSLWIDKFSEQVLSVKCENYKILIIRSSK